MKPVFAEILRDLDEADIAALDLPRNVKSPTLRKLTEMHHCIARLVAQGEAGYAIAMATGYSESRISILKADPAFQELVAHYSAEVDDIRRDAFANSVKKAAAVREDTLESLHDDLLEGRLEPRDKMDLYKMTADRSGMGPASKTQNTNFNIDLADAIAVGRQRVIELSAAVPAAQAGRGLAPPLPRPAEPEKE